MKVTTRGLEIRLQQLSKPAPADAVTNITNANPPVVTPASIANYAAGDIVMVDKTGFDEIDGMYFPISNVTGTTFELDCADTSAQAAAATTGVLKVYKFQGAATNMAKWCLTSYSYDQPAAETVDLSTFCGTESASGQPQPATYSIAGIVDECEEGQAEMMAALRDGKDRLMMIKKPTEPPAYIFQTVDVGNYSESFEMNAAVTFTAGGNVKSGPFRVYCKSCVDYLPISAAVAGAGTATATITFSGGPADQAYTVTLTASGPTGSITGLTPVQITKGMTAAQVATAVATMLEGKQDATAADTLHAVAAGGVVSVSEVGGGTISALTAVIA